jgi:outer membrane lipoprotein-sorting protein
MKTLIKPSLIVLAAVVGFTPLRAQTADEIVAKNIDAMGGKSAIEGVKSMAMDVNLSVQGNDVPMSISIVYGKGYKTEGDFNGTKFVTTITDKGGWTVNPMAGSSSPTAIPDDQYKGSKHQIDLGGPLYNYAAKGYKLELAGQDSADYKLKVTTADAVVINVFVNKKTWLVDRQVQTSSAQGQEGEVSTAFSDYKKPDNGYLIPWSMEIVTPQITLTFTYKKVEVNKDIDPKIFDMPK